MNTHSETGGTAPVILISALDRGEWLVSRASRFTPGAHWSIGSVGHTVGVEVLKKTQISCVYRDSKP